MKYNYSRISTDYHRVVKIWGDPSDMTGGFVDGDKFKELLKCPTKQKAASIMKSILDYGFQDKTGYYNSEEHGFVWHGKCPVLTEIYRRYYEDLNY